MVGHDHEGIRHIVPQDFSIVADRVHHHLRNRWLTQIEGAAASLLQQAIQCREGLAGGHLTRGKDPLRRQTAVQPERKEYRLPYVSRYEEDGAEKTLA